MQKLLYRDSAVQKRTRLSIVVPCFNERENVDRLGDSLHRAIQLLAGRYEIETVLVNDGSQDDTLERLTATFGTWPRLQILSHAENQGIAAAMVTGIQACEASLVCTLDADCSYDPMQLQGMLDLMSDEIDVVTASPYHPAGQVQGLVSWRIGLSRMASVLYRFVFRQRLNTYTSCCRVYRRDCVRGIQLRYAGFVGITELLWRLDQAGYRIVEFPATLRSREAGKSKMCLLRVATQHAQFWGNAAWQRWFR